MNESERKLISLITDEVLKVINQGAKQDASPPAPIRPPIGQCTGDYSKFPELAGRMNPASSPPAPTPAAAIPLTGIVTANQLHEAMDKAGDGVAVLAPDARLTPLANDLARQLPQRIRRGSAATGANAAGAVAPAANWLWWIDGECSAASSIVSQRSHLLRAMGGAHVGQIVRDLAAAVKSKQAFGGILFVGNAAKSMCFANRASSLRAVVGTCGEAVEQGISELGANVLVIEYPYTKPDAMTVMVDRFIGRAPSVPAGVQRELADLQRNG